VLFRSPEFDGHEVDFKELVMRNRAYLREEKASMEKFLHKDGKCMGNAVQSAGNRSATAPETVTTGGAR
jgi:hypothetical protein